jgi:hypothetical protein
VKLSKAGSANCRCFFRMKARRNSKVGAFEKPVV